MSDPDRVVDCRNCGEPISTTASRCPHCDHRVTTKPWGIGVGVSGLAIAAIFVVGGLTDLFVLRNWQAGVGAGLFILLMGARLYWIRASMLADARPPEDNTT